MSNSDTEMKDLERTVIAKPVASRPSSSNFRSFSELLAGAIDPSPPTTSTDAAIAAIRPKTVRFKPTANRSPPSAAVTSQIETSRNLSGDSRDDNVLKPDSSSKTTVIYKPQAKLVSRSTVSLLANMGNFEPVPHQRTNSTAEPRGVQRSTAEKPHQYSSPILHQTSEPPKVVLAPQPTEEEEPKTLPSLANVDRPSYDGYNWRKYGQKQVKGSEYPRSYYKCTHPNCPVKKKVERSFDGQIAEIVYKGEHNHAKPQPPKKASSGTTAAPDLVSPLLDSRVAEGRVEGSSHQGASLQVYEPVVGNTAVVDPENSCGVSGEYEEGSKGVEMEDDQEPRSKRRKGENSASVEAGASGKGPTEARVLVQNSAEPETAGDGFRWRKYGQKVVKGNPYPRSYYRCTSLKCNVRKHVERVSDDPNAFVTTYEGRHNHEMPVRNTNAAGPESDNLHAAATRKDN